MTERELLAAEMALRLLSNEEQEQTRAEMARDPELSELVAEWEARLAPLANELEEVPPDPQTWQRINQSLTRPRAENDNDRELAARLRVQLRRARWGGAVAAAAALVLGYLGAPLLQRGTGPVIDSPAPAMLAASLPVGGEQGPRLALTYLPQSRDLVVEASNVPGDGVHDHELWLVVPDGNPISIGVIASGTQQRVALPAELAQRIDTGLGVVLTREPLGGAPKGGTAGPVVASGKFSTI
jgi:anti-sigma-K factor RskA